ncbi:MAG: nucleotidyltransferase family protein, partial [Alphaproteobacteria bacterium]
MAEGIAVPRHAMVMAAGRGSRMGTLGSTTAKPMLEVAGTSLIHRCLGQMAGDGVGEVVVNLHHQADALRRHLAVLARPRITLSAESTLLDTGGGVVRALPWLGPDHFMVANGDGLWQGTPSPFQTLAAAWREEAMDALLLLKPRHDVRGDTRSAGDYFRDDGGRLQRRPAVRPAPYMYASVTLYHRRALADAPDGVFGMRDLWDRLERRGRLYGAVYAGDWWHLTTPEDLARAND